MVSVQGKDWERLYRDAARLIETMPLLNSSALTPEEQHWLARVYAIVDETRAGTDFLNIANKIDAIQFDRAMIGFDSIAAGEIKTMLYRAFAVAERNAPVGIAGAFIPTGAAFDVFTQLTRVFKSATKDVLLVDAYMDETALTDFAVAVPEGVGIRLLADKADHKVTLEPAAKRWQQQHGCKRPVQLRLALPKALHDRAMFIDGKDVWLVSQSFKDIAKRSPATISRAEGDIPAAKLSAYESLWAGATVLL